MILHIHPTRTPSFRVLKLPKLETQSLGLKEDVMVHDVLSRSRAYLGDLPTSTYARRNLQALNL